MTISKSSFSCHCALMVLSIPNKQPPRTRTIKRLGVLLQVLLDLLKFLFQVVIITCESQVLHDFHGHARSPLLPLLVRQGGSLLLRLDPLPRQRAPYLSGLHHDLQEVVHIVFLLLLLYEWQRSSKRIPSVIVERMICSGDMYAIKDTLCCSMNKGYIKGLKRIRFCCLLFALLCRLACQFVILPIRNLALTWAIANKSLAWGAHTEWSCIANKAWIWRPFEPTKSLSTRTHLPSCSSCRWLWEPPQSHELE